ncbi:MAG: hypothetical protein K0S53_2446 [Bacteroidetes bacterium]|jgi:hypothetical protein|nr:hypothetical protein [Bacteroidota bacterium]MDF2450884.1 hypothetical protein [Bacteroidota bacterium]
MKNSKTTLLKLSGIVLIASIALFSCASSMEEKYTDGLSSKSLADSVSATVQAIKQPKLPGDSNRTFVKTADLSFKVKDVKNATFDIERIVSEHNGYVTSSVLESNVNYKNSVRVNKDSMLDIINYTVHNNLIMRIPNTELDKTLTEISGLIDYLDYRKIKADDVTKQFQAAKLSENRFVGHKKRLEKAIDHTGKKLGQIVEAENELLVKQEWADNSKLNTLELAHDVSYSTVSINIYQKETTKKETYAYTFPVEPYTPNFGAKFLTSLSGGASIFGEIILFFVKLWPIALLVTGIIALIKIILKRKWLVS